ncbi:Phosphoenolpyruvate/pyruvate domain-containing protein [Thozetella sp. PMI_491]|nr:Phosphoenolpyruvate/pyruvate domain-containing protein [Thozetella sp. PMI_491]
MYQNTTETQPPTPGTDALEPPQTFIQAATKKQTPCLGIALTIPSIVIGQMIANTGCDFAFIDMEHSPISPELATHLVHSVVSASRGSCFPLIRIPSHGVEWIKWSLDSGAAGIIIPYINNKTEMEQVLDRALYPPHGRRSFGPAMAPWGLPDGPEGGVGTYFQRARQGGVAILPMIESKEAVENAEEIIAMEGVSGVFIGPMDLRLSLGLGGLDGNEPEYLKAVAKVCRLSKQYGKIVGSLGTDPDSARKRTNDGMNFLVTSADASVLADGFRKSLEVARNSTKATGRPYL